MLLNQKHCINVLKMDRLRINERIMELTIKIFFLYSTYVSFKANMSNTCTYTFQNCSLKNVNSSCFQ